MYTVQMEEGASACIFKDAKIKSIFLNYSKKLFETRTTFVNNNHNIKCVLLYAS